jgi:peroxiredoxin
MEMLTNRANIVRPLLLGEPAPNMILIDTTEKLTSLYSLKAKYTLVLFWDYDCGICKREITELKKLYAENQLGMEVFAVSVNGDLAKWKKAINDHQMPWINVNGTRSATPDFHDLYDIHGTPVLYLLDSDKKIVAKRIGAEQIPDLIRSLE